jgi:predicted  nucleic acid-binding Zn-ribbon protein
MHKDQIQSYIESYTGNNLAVDLAALLEHETIIKQNIRALNHKLEVIETKYEEAKDKIWVEIQKVQNRCPHIEKTYYGDPSGGNDSFYKCDWCGMII